MLTISSFVVNELALCGQFMVFFVILFESVMGPHQFLKDALHCKQGGFVDKGNKAACKMTLRFVLSCFRKSRIEIIFMD